MKRQKPKQSPEQGFPYKPADPAMIADEPPLVIREQDFLEALESPDIQQTLVRVHKARESGVFGPSED